MEKIQIEANVVAYGYNISTALNARMPCSYRSKVVLNMKERLLFGCRQRLSTPEHFVSVSSIYLVRNGGYMDYFAEGSSSL